MLSKTQLADQFALQHQMNSIVNPDWLKAGYAWNRAIMVEAVEALDHYGWKWWRESKPDVAQVQIELVDIWHFVLSATLVGTNGDANWASESIFGRFASAPSSDVAASSTPMLFDILAGDAASGHFNASVFAALMRRLELSWDALHNMYIAKNVLNIFRQAHGYKYGGYIKEWFGKEDNVVLADLLVARPDATPAQLAQKLESIYTQVTAGVTA